MKEAGGEVWEAYQMALKRGHWFRAEPHNFGGQRPRMSPPRVGEDFLDQIVFGAGGRRLTAEERANDEAQNADYILDNFVLEGKDLQEERLAKEECHEKIAELFWPYFEEDGVVPLDPSVLTPSDFERYVEILGRPIQRIISKASKQIQYPDSVDWNILYCFFHAASSMQQRLAIPKK